MLHRIEIGPSPGALGAHGVGFIDSAGDVVVEPKYSQANEYREGRAGVHVAARGWGIVDEKGAVIVEPRHDKVGYFAEGLCGVLDRDQGWGFVDREGELVIPHRIRNQWAVFAFPYFSEGLCAVPSDDGTKWGYLDREGELVVPHQFAYAYPFVEGFAVVEDEKGRASYIDRTGKPAFDGHWKRAWRFDHGVAAAGQSRAWGVLDVKGNWLHPPELVWDEQHAPKLGARDPVEQLDRPLEFHEERALFRTDKKKWGYLSPRGEVVIPATYEKGGAFADGLAPVMKKVKGQSRWGLVDPAGARVLDHVIEHMETYCRYSHGLVPAAVKHGYGYKWGYVDRTGAVIVPHRFDAAYSFRDGLARVQLGDVAGYVDPRGELVWRSQP